MITYNFSDGTGDWQERLDPNQDVFKYLKKNVNDIYEKNDKTYWVNVCARTEESFDIYKIPVSPRVPKCNGPNHEWSSDYDLVGGCRENPGVFGSGGGVKIIEECIHCNVRKITNTWDYDPVDGEQGLTSVKYEKIED